MNKICTSIEQSQKLIALGIDICTADMLWTYDFTVNAINGLNVISELLKPEENDIPAWSLSKLMELIRNYTTRYEISVYEGGFYIEFEDFITESYFNPVDAAFEMVVWLKENKKI